MFAVALLCALAGAAAGSSVAWPGAVAVPPPAAHALVPGETQASGYSTVQYINAVPAQFPHAAPPYAAAYHPFLSSAFVPGANVYYPSQGFPLISGFGPSPIVPGSLVVTGTPSIPSESSGPAFPPGGPSIQAPGDVDTAVIESADFKPERPMELPSPTRPPQGSPAPPQSSDQSGAPFPSLQSPFLPESPANTFPNFPDFSQTLPGYPGFPSLPDIGQHLPQTPGQPQIPQFPSNLFPQGPSQAPPSSFPSAASGDKGLNDADTISVESA